MLKTVVVELMRLYCLFLKDCIWKSTPALERDIFGDVAWCYGMKEMFIFMEVHAYGWNLTSNVSAWNLGLLIMLRRLHITSMLMYPASAMYSTDILQRHHRRQQRHQCIRIVCTDMAALWVSSNGVIVLVPCTGHSRQQPWTKDYKSHRTK